MKRRILLAFAAASAASLSFAKTDKAGRSSVFASYPKTSRRFI